MNRVQTSVDGAVCYWTLTDFSRHEVLKQGFEAEGLGKLAPEPMPAGMALRTALSEALGTSTQLIRPLADDNAFSVVAETRGKQINDYQQVLYAKVDCKTRQIEFIPFDDRADAIVARYNARSGHVQSGQVGHSMVAVLAKMGGTALRKTGGVYFVPGSKIDAWERVATVVERSAVSGVNKVYMIRHSMDEAAVRAVRDAIANEILADAKRMDEELQEDELGAKAIDTRKRQCVALQDKIALYESILGESLKDLNQAVDAVQMALGRAMLHEMAGAA